MIHELLRHLHAICPDIGRSMEMSTVSCVNGVLTAVATATERLEGNESLSIRCSLCEVLRSVYVAILVLVPVPVIVASNIILSRTIVKP